MIQKIDYKTPFWDKNVPEKSDKFPSREEAARKILEEYPNFPYVFRCAYEDFLNSWTNFFVAFEKKEEIEEILKEGWTYHLLQQTNRKKEKIVNGFPNGMLMFGDLPLGEIYTFENFKKWAKTHIISEENRQNFCRNFNKDLKERGLEFVANEIVAVNGKEYVLKELEFDEKSWNMVLSRVQGHYSDENHGVEKLTYAN